jgi:stage III sporulation protein SpoIIIAA
MVDYAALKAEIAKPSYEKMDDAETAVAVMKATVAIDRRVPSAEVARLWARRGVLANAREAGNRGASVAVRVLGWRVLDVVERDVLGDLDTADATDRSEFSAFLNQMVTASIMGDADRTATIALIQKPRTGLEVFGPLDENDIKIARAS